MRCDFPTEKKRICKEYTLDEITKVNAQLYPDGNAWNGKLFRQTKLYKFIRGKAKQSLGLLNFIETLCEDYDPAFTEYLIERWERLVGIPDECFSVPATLEERRFLILIKLSALNLRTPEDYIELAECFGIEIKIRYPEGSTGGFPYQFPYQFTDEDDIFIVIIDIILNSSSGGFPYQFPYQFGFPQEANFLMCLFNKAKPIYIKFEYNVIRPQTPPSSGSPFFTGTDGTFIVSTNSTFINSTEVVST